MKPCHMAGGQCPHEATCTARIDGIGDRALCQKHGEFIVTMGMGRILNTDLRHAPEWTRRSLARDFTGRVLA